MVGLWAIPVASAETTATVTASAQGAEQCVTVTYDDGTSQAVEIPAGVPVTVTNGAALAVADPDPAE